MADGRVKTADLTTSLVGSRAQVSGRVNYADYFGTKLDLADTNLWNKSLILPPAAANSVYASVFHCSPMAY